MAEVPLGHVDDCGLQVTGTAGHLERREQPVVADRLGGGRRVDGDPAGVHRRVLERVLRGVGGEPPGTGSKSSLVDQEGELPAGASIDPHRQREGPLLGLDLPLLQVGR